MKSFLFLLFFFSATIISAQTFKAGDKVQIEWKGKWYPGKIESVRGDKFTISYDGYDASWNETVGKDRLKAADATTTTNSTTSTNSTSTNTPSYSSYKSVETMWDLVPSADGKYLLATSAYGKLYILDAITLEEKSMIKLTEGSPIYSAAWSPDGNYIVTGFNDGNGIVYQKTEGLQFTPYDTLEGYSSVYKLRFSPKGNYLMLSGAPKEDYTDTQIDIWDIEKKKIKFNLLKSTNADHSISDIEWSKDGSKIAVGISNKKKGILLYDSTGKLTKTISHTHDVTAVSFSPDGGMLVSGGIDGKVTLWNLSNYTKIWTKNWKDEGVEYVTDISFAPNGLTIAVCGRGGGYPIRIYNLASGSVKKDIGEANPVGNAIFFSSDSKNIYTAFTTYGDFAKVPVVCRYSITE